MPTHAIRLRGFWEITAENGQSRHARKFGRPRIDDAKEHVWLVCSHVSGPAEVFLNDGRLGTLTEASQAFALEVTNLLNPRNELVFVIPEAGVLGDVAVEIRS